MVAEPPKEPRREVAAAGPVMAPREAWMLAAALEHSAQTAESWFGGKRNGGQSLKLELFILFWIK